LQTFGISVRGIGVLNMSKQNSGNQTIFRKNNKNIAGIIKTNRI
jgi:hypothetical protein